MRAPLTLITWFLALSFLDGFFGWGLSDGFYTFGGLIFMIGIGWMWYLELKK